MAGRGIILGSLFAALGSTVLVPPAQASHGGSVVDCGSAGTYTIQVTEVPGHGGERPFPWAVLLFEEGGTLTIFKFVENGTVLIDKNPTGRAQNSVDEVTCTFTFSRGLIEVTGILAR